MAVTSSPWSWRSAGILSPAGGPPPPRDRYEQRSATVLARPAQECRASIDVEKIGQSTGIAC